MDLLSDKEGQHNLLTLLAHVKEEMNVLKRETEQMQRENNGEIQSISTKLKDEIHTIRQEFQGKVHALEESEAELKRAVHTLIQKSQFQSSNDDPARTAGSDFCTEMTSFTSREGGERSVVSAVLLRNIINDDGLPLDTFTLMMTSRFCGLAWGLGLATFAFQMILTIMISIDQIRDSFESSTFNAPFKVDNIVRVGQLLTIIFTLATQNDAISSIRFGVMFWSHPDWDRVVLRKPEDAPLPTSTEWRLHILLPNALKFLQGFLVIFVTFVLIVQSDNIIDLLKDFAALMILSETDNIIFWLAVNGYLGKELQRNTIRAREIEIKDEVVTLDDEDPRHISASSTRGFLIRSIILLSITILMTGGWIAIAVNQMNGTFFYKRYPNCTAPEDQPDMNMFDLAKKYFGDEICYGGPLNTLGCEFEDGDCVHFNLAFPTCKGINRTHVQESVGNGICDEAFMHEDCQYDGGDCCPHSIINDPLFGDGQCNGGLFGTRRCGYDNGDCNDFNRAYPKCPLQDLSEFEGAADVVLGDGFCNGGIYSIKECGNEYGDCNLGQVGQEIIIPERLGFADDVFFNMKMSLSGDTMAIGLYGTDESGNFDAKNPGLVKMMKYSSVKKVWMQMGKSIIGDANRDNLGSGIALSARGNHIATNVNSKIKVLQLDEESPNGSWNQIGQVIPTEFGVGSFDMTSEGSRLAIADSEQNKGKIMVYNLDSTFPTISKNERSIHNQTEVHQQEWVVLGHTGIDGKFSKDNIGSWNVQLNSLDGSRVLFSVGAPYSQYSKIRVYQHYQNASSSENRWTQMGYDIESPYSSSSRISEDGNRVAVSLYSTDTDNPGQVQVLDYDRDKNEWVNVGAPIFGSKSRVGDGFGYSITLSSDGNFLVIGSNDPECQFSPNSFDTEICTTKSVEFFVYHRFRRRFNKAPPIPFALNVQENILDMKNLSDRRSTFGLHFSMSGNAASMSISGYNFDQNYAFVETFALNDLFYTKCAVDQPDEIGNGACYDHPPYNTEACGFDGGDCIVEGFPNCFVPNPAEIGNGSCNLSPPYNTQNCGFDGGDCELKPVKNYVTCFVADPEEIGNRKCTNYPPYNTTACGFDGGDCVVKGYPTCFVDNPDLIGNGECNDAPYSTDACGFDGGDCVLVDGYPDCIVGDPDEVGNGKCKDIPPYNTEECGFDGRDCNQNSVPFYPNCFVHTTTFIGDGYCRDWPPYNTEECGLDGGDCILKPVPGYPNCIVHNPESIGDGKNCHDRAPYNTKDCGFDGGDCDIHQVGNYTDCFVHIPEQIGDGNCNDWTPYNTEECGYDGGDCENL